jgi:predicted PurR-regulated permease PerM
MKNNPITQLQQTNKNKIIAILAYCVSAYFSISALAESSYDIFAQFAYIVFAITFEYGKVYCLYRLFSEVKYTSPELRTICKVSYVVAVVFSIIFSMTFIINNENFNTKIATETSTVAENQKSLISTDQNSIKRLESEIDTIKSKYTDSITQKQNYANSLSNNYISLKKKTLSEIDVLNDKMKLEISKIESQITSKEKSLKTNLSTAPQASISYKGFKAVLHSIVIWQNNTSTGKLFPWKLEQVQVILQSMNYLLHLY